MKRHERGLNVRIILSVVLANLYFTQKNMEELATQSSSIYFSTGQDLDASNGGQEQVFLLKEVMERKWWKSLDGIFSYSNYMEDDFVQTPSPSA